MSKENNVFGWWNNRVCVYSDAGRKDIIIGQLPKNGDSSQHGYIRYLSFSDNKINLQVSTPVMGGEKVTHHDIPPEVASAAIESAIGHILLWLSAQEARKS